MSIPRRPAFRLTAAIVLAAVAGASSAPVPPVPRPVMPLAATVPVRDAVPAGPCRGSSPADLDGDGTEDVAAGAPYATIGGQTRAGAVAVRHAGKVTWLSQGGADPAERGDGFGAALAVGDFNGDRCGDLAVGVPEETFGTRRPGADGQGAVQVFFGSPSGPKEGPLLSMRTLRRPYGTDRFGAALAAADIDGDRDDELIVGVPGLSGGGGVALFGLRGRGTAHGLRPGPLLRAPSGTRGHGDDTVDFGAVLAAGDFDGDDRAEIAAGTPGDGETGQGAVTVLDPLTRATERLTQATPGVHGGPERFDGFGAALAAGDFDDDGVDDLVVGVPGEDDGRVPPGHNEGAVHVLYGPSMRQRDPNVSQRRPGPYDRFGAALAAGDLNGDGVTDLAIGAPGRGAVRTLRGVRHRGLSERGGVRVERRGTTQFGWALLIRNRTLYVGAPGAQGFAGAVTVVSGGPPHATLPMSGNGLLGYALG